MATYEIPLSPEPQKFSIDLGANTYELVLEWGYVNDTWLLHMNDENGVRLLSSIPLVAGVNLLAPYAYMNLGGALYARTEGGMYVAPTYENLGTLGRVFFVTP